MSIRIGTRTSTLARAQAQSVLDRLQAADPTQFAGAQLIPIAMASDHSSAGDKSRWVTELEAALINGRIDLAVHSAKDVPAALPPELVIAAAPPRADARDVLCSTVPFDQLPAGARVGTASLRRAAQLRRLRPDLQLLNLRGNVDTRLARLDAGDFDAIVVAYAGLERLGRTDRISSIFEPDRFVPAAGPGTLAVEPRIDSQLVDAVTAAISDRPTELALRAERAVTTHLAADCHAPIGVHARLDPAAESLQIDVFLGLPDGSRWLRDHFVGPAEEPERLGVELAERLSAAGAQTVLSAAAAAAQS